MKKEEIKRHHLKGNIMKQLIFRIDYQGVQNYQELIDSEFVESVFQERITTFQNSINLQISNIEEVSENLSIPVKEIQQQEIQRYSKCVLGKEDVILDISRYFTILTVICNNNYEGIDRYSDFFSNLIHTYYNRSKYIKIKRLGLRKIGGDIFFDPTNINEVFDKEHFNFDFSKTGFYSNKISYLNVLETPKLLPQVNYIRTLEKGIYIDDGAEKEAYQVILDIDAYCQNGRLESAKFGERTNVKPFIDHINNDFLFEIYKMSMTENFLNDNLHEKHKH